MQAVHQPADMLAVILDTEFAPDHFRNALSDGEPLGEVPVTGQNGDLGSNDSRLPEGAEKSR